MAQKNYIGSSALLYIVTKIKAILTSDYVAKDGTKVLTDNNFSDEDKAKLDGIAAQATKVIVDSELTKNGKNPVEGGAIYSVIAGLLTDAELLGTPKAPTADPGTNTTQIATTAFVKAAVTAAVASVSGIEFQKVDALPEAGEKGVIYLVAKTGKNQDKYDEYYWTGDDFEYMGTTAVDLSGYLKETDFVEITNADIDAVFNTVFL